MTTRADRQLRACHRVVCESCRGAAQFYSECHSENPKKCSRESLKYGEGVPLSIVELLDELRELVESPASSGVQPTATPRPAQPTATPSGGGNSAGTQPTATPTRDTTIEDAVIDALSPPSEGSGGSCNATGHNGTVSGGHVGMLAVPLGLLVLSLWRRRAGGN